MTTPDTLASLIAKWRNKATESRREADRIRRTVNVSTEAEANCYIRAEVWDRNADELEAALDALAEKLEAEADRWARLHRAKHAVPGTRETILREVAAELRGRGASE